MREPEARRATTAALSIATFLGLDARYAVVLNDSNKLSLRLLPCDVVARVAPVAQQVAQFEVDVSRRLAAAGCPVGTLDPRVEPRVYERAGFAITLWTYYETVPSRDISSASYAEALARLHAGMRPLELAIPRFTDRVDAALELVAAPERTSALPARDRALLDETLRRFTRAVGDRGREQPLHGEPHPGNVLDTRDGAVFIDLETCCRGPIEFDLAHAPEDVAEHYPGVDRGLLRECRILVLAMITCWRWDAGDELPDGRRLGTEWLAQLRSLIERERH